MKTYTVTFKMETNKDEAPHTRYTFQDVFLINANSGIHAIKLVLDEIQDINPDYFKEAECLDIIPEEVTAIF